MLLYGCMDQYCIHNGIPLGAHFIYLNFDSILAWWWPYLAETCRRTKNWYCHFMIRIVVFVDWLIYYYTAITQRDGSYQNKKKRASVSSVPLPDLTQCRTRKRKTCSWNLRLWDSKMIRIWKDPVVNWWRHLPGRRYRGKPSDPNEASYDHKSRLHYEVPLSITAVRTCKMLTSFRLPWSGKGRLALQNI
jgi:hypothetical protein